MATNISIKKLYKHLLKKDYSLALLRVKLEAKKQDDMHSTLAY